MVKNLPEMQEATYKAGDPGSIPGLGKFPVEGYGDPLQYSCLGNRMEREAWWATVCGIAGVRHSLATKPPPLSASNKFGLKM